MRPSRRAFLQGSLGAGLLTLGAPSLAQPQPTGPAARLAAAGFRGEILTPESGRYREARRMFIFNPRRPAAPRIIAI